MPCVSYVSNLLGSILRYLLGHSCFDELNKLCPINVMSYSHAYWYHVSNMFCWVECDCSNSFSVPKSIVSCTGIAFKHKAISFVIIDVGARGHWGTCPPRFCNKQRSALSIFRKCPVFRNEKVPSKRRAPPPNFEMLPTSLFAIVKVVNDTHAFFKETPIWHENGIV